MSENQTILRLSNLIKELYEERYSEPIPLNVTCTTDREPIPLETLPEREFRPIEKGTRWGEIWDSAWFRLEGTVPRSWNGRTVAALIDIGGEGCVFRNGSPWCGITYKKTEELFERKRRVVLHREADGGEKVSLLVEGAANGMFGKASPWDKQWPFFTLNQAELVTFQPEVWQLAMDMDFLLKLYKVLDPKTPRARRILHGLNRAANLIPLTERLEEAAEITRALIDTPANASSLTAWSVGHAHLDLAWLWRYRETRRKAGRTFSTALRLMEEYPDYVFGASQPQLYDWVKKDYPVLYDQVKQAVREGRWECQGAMWVEPDMNLAGGEALVRQCLYGKMFFRQEMEQDMNHLWLPDVFGYSAALPQILKKSGVDYFITQKISWNETNRFPHHTFLWEGIDGTAVETHFLPANDYNCSNEPEKMAGAARRFAQSEIHDGFLNLFGIGDGGGGPSRRHIEWGLRSRSTEGLPRWKPARADEFLDYLSSEGTEDLPRWRGELYLELHRGTYTTQGKMKKYNRRLELELRDTEFLGALAEEYPREELERIWKETLTNQFHDVLPGSSIAEVYEDAHEISEKNLRSLREIREGFLAALFPVQEESITVLNTQPWERTELIRLSPDRKSSCLSDPEGREIPLVRGKDGIYGRVTVPSMGYVTLSAEDHAPSALPEEVTLSAEGDILENRQIRVILGEDGTITSLFDKECGQEVFTPEGANHFRMYEDKPYSWDAWDISSYYRETPPETACLTGRRILESCGLLAAVEQTFTLGDSRIVQILELHAGEGMIRSRCRAEWRENRKMLRLCAYPSVRSDRAVYEIQYGTIARPTHGNTSWDEAKFEVCGHRFADLSQKDRGVALINDCKYGHRIQDGTMELTLLRSPGYPDTGADRGEHGFAFAYMPHRGDYTDGGVLPAAHNFNTPLTVLKGRRGKETRESCFSLDGGSVKLEVVKPAESGEGLVLRLYETAGASCRTRLQTALPWREVQKINLLEETEGVLCEEYSDKGIDLTFTPFEIKSLKLV